MPTPARRNSLCAEGLAGVGMALPEPNTMFQWL